MGLSIGIIGLPNVGKSTLFNALSKKSVLVANYPFSTIDPSVGVVAVPDERLIRLSAFSKSAKTIPAAVRFVDIAGLVEGASEGAGLGNQFLAHIREVDVIAQVVRIFEDDRIMHVSDTVDPLRDIEVVNLELTLADLQTVSKRLRSIERGVKAGRKEALAEERLLLRLKKVLESGQPAAVSADAPDASFLRQLHLLTRKPVLYIFNATSIGRNVHTLNDGRWQKLEEFLARVRAWSVVVDAAVKEREKDSDVPEKTARRRGSSASGALSGNIETVIKRCYELLGMITFFTTGPDETRAWTVKRGVTAPEAGREIHSDFCEKFIRAEVISYEELLAAGSLAGARVKGLIRTEGKKYVVRDGDVITFNI